MPIVRIIAAVVDTKRLQLYRENGTTIDIPQGDPRLADIVSAAEPLANPVAFKLPKNSNGSFYIDVEIPDRDVPKDNTIADYEKKTGGLTRFFRVAKNKLAAVLGFDEPVKPVHPITLGNPVVPAPKDEPKKDPKVSAAIADIMAHAEPVSNPTFDVDETKEDQTIIAVVEDEKGEKSVVPDVQNLKNHMAAAAKSGNTKGMQAFLARLAGMGKKRNHTVEELMRFMERGDLPLADDGTIIAYKVLRSTRKDGTKLAPGDYVDCHSGKVEQRVGSFVCQDEKIIDGSRAECSTGLHIARRGYLGGFSGDIITMVKIRPEDVVSVPAYDANKMRVSGYHIIGLVPKNEHSFLRSNEAMKGTNALKLLTMAIEGKHIDITEIVEITAAFGGAFTRKPVEGAHGKRPQLEKETPVTAPVVEVPKVEKDKLDAAPVDPKATAKKVTEVKKLTVSEYARELYTNGKLEELNVYKKKAKKSWQALGFSHEEIVLIAGPNGQLKTSPVTNGQPANERTIPKMEGTRAEVARKLFDKAAGGDKPSWGHLWLHRKECKKSWEILGFNAKEITRIKTNKPDWV